MRIGFDSKRLFNNITGLGNYSRTLLRNLESYYPENEYYLYTPKLTRTSETSYFLNHPGFHTRVSTSVFKPYWRSYAIVDQLRADGIQVYHGLSHEIPFGIHKAEIRSILTVHDLIYKIYPEIFNFLDKKMYDAKYRYSCKYANRIIAISHNTKKDIIRYYHIDPEKIDVIYQTCDPLFFQPLKEGNTEKVLLQYTVPNEYLLYVGTIERRKNLKTIVEAYRFLEPGDQLPLMIIGQQKAYIKEVRKLIRDLDLEKKIIWIEDLMDNNLLQVLYHRASAFVYPSHYEGFGLPVLEALLSKTPVITSSVSSLPESGGPAARLVDPEKPEELADAIHKVLNDSALRTKMIDSGYAYAMENFNPEDITKQIRDCYIRTMEDAPV